MILLCLSIVQNYVILLSVSERLDDKIDKKRRFAQGLWSVHTKLQRDRDRGRKRGHQRRSKYCTKWIYFAFQTKQHQNGNGIVHTLRTCTKWSCNPFSNVKLYVVLGNKTNQLQCCYVLLISMLSASVKNYCNYAAFAN